MYEAAQRLVDAQQAYQQAEQELKLARSAWARLVSEHLNIRVTLDEAVRLAQIACRVALEGANG